MALPSASLILMLICRSGHLSLDYRLSYKKHVLQERVSLHHDPVTIYGSNHVDPGSTNLTEISSIKILVFQIYTMEFMLSTGVFLIFAEQSI